MPQRIRGFNFAWMEPYGRAAELTVEAGRATARGLEALGAGIGGGLARMGARKDALAAEGRANAREDSVREQTWARQDARDEREFGQRIAMTQLAMDQAALKDIDGEIASLEQNMALTQSAAGMAPEAAAQLQPWMEQGAKRLAELRGNREVIGARAAAVQTQFASRQQTAKACPPGKPG